MNTADTEFSRGNSLLSAVMVGLLVAVVFQSIGLSEHLLANGSTSPIDPTAANLHIITVGSGNSSILVNQFLPRNLEINVGDNVTWHNLAEVPEAHTVTFLFDKNLSAGEYSPFEISNSTQFFPIPAAANSEPVMAPAKNGSMVVFALNIRAANPIVIDSIGDITYLDANASYNLQGSEKYVNSGAIFPKGEASPPFQNITQFTLIFDKAGTYDYACIIHPWMTGTVSVK